MDMVKQAQANRTELIHSPCLPLPVCWEPSSLSNMMRAPERRRAVNKANGDRPPLSRMRLITLLAPSFNWMVGSVVVTPDVLGMWSRETSAGGGISFAARAAPSNVPVWRVNLPPDAESMNVAFNSLQASLWFTDEAIHVAVNCLTEYVQSQTGAAGSKRQPTFSGKSASRQPEAELNHLLLAGRNKDHLWRTARFV